MAIVQTPEVLFLEYIQGISIKFYKNVLWVTLCEVSSTRVDWSKTMAASGWAFCYSVNMKNLLPQNVHNRFQ